MIWNQKEVYCGYSLQQFNKVMDALDFSKIKYKYKIANNFGSSSGRGSFGQNMKYAHMYYVYVHQKDYDQACFALKNVKHE
jgi:hypothetical protein